MICSKKGIFFNQEYRIQLLSDHVKLVNSQKQQQNILISETSVIAWKFERNRLKSFGIEINNKWEYFEMEKDQIELLKQFLDGKVQYYRVHFLYRVVSFEGKGTYGQVFKYQNLYNQEFVACKSIKISSKSTQNEFMNEVKTLQNLKHPNIVKIKEFYIEPKHFYLVLEYLNGKSLKHLINSRKLTENEIFIVIKQILNAFVYIHNEGYIFRDLKHDNIMFEESNNLMTLKIIDFGLSVKIRQLELINNFGGTPGFMAPEVANRQLNQISQACDMFSIGVVLWEMLMGTSLLKGQDLKEQYSLNQNFKLSSEITDGIKNSVFKNLIENLLQTIPTQRMTSNQALEYLTNNWIDEYKNYTDEQQIGMAGCN